MKELLKKLTETTAPSGHEADIRNLIRKEIEPYADEINVDVMGNLIARKGRKQKNGHRILIAAHMDEIGLMASHISEKGFVYVASIGGVNPLTCVGSRVVFLNGTAGVIYLETEKIDKVPTISQLFIDVGATSADDCPVSVGDVCVFDRPFVDMGKRMVAKAMDDRVGCLLAIETLKQIKNSPNELVFVFTTQEEVGLRGAATSAYGVDPEIGIALDVTLSADTPHCTPVNQVLGEGPCIKVRDSSLIAHPAVIEAMKKAAASKKIKVQMEVLRFAGTDAGAIHTVRSGVPSGCLSIACRYVHSPSEMVDTSDVENAIVMLKALLENPIAL